MLICQATFANAYRSPVPPSAGQLSWRGDANRSAKTGSQVVRNGFVRYSRFVKGIKEIYNRAAAISIEIVYHYISRPLLTLLKLPR